MAQRSNADILMLAVLHRRSAEWDQRQSGRFGVDTPLAYVTQRRSTSFQSQDNAKLKCDISVRNWYSEIT